MMDGRVGTIRTPARRGGPLGRPDHRLQRQVRLRLLRAVPRGRRLDPGVRRPPRLPDGSRQRRRGGARGAARPRGGRRRGHGEARAALPRRDPTGQGRDRRPARRLPRLRRVLDAEGRRSQRLARRAGGRDGVARRDPARRRRHRSSPTSPRTPPPGSPSGKRADEQARRRHHDGLGEAEAPLP